MFIFILWLNCFDHYGNLQTLRKLCPTSVKITFRNLQLGLEQSLEECLQMEYRLILRVIAGKNFNEGELIFEI